jgi:hypothetical protein
MAEKRDLGPNRIASEKGLKGPVPIENTPLAGNSAQNRALLRRFKQKRAQKNHLCDKKEREYPGF